MQGILSIHNVSSAFAVDARVCIGHETRGGSYVTMLFDGGDGTWNMGNYAECGTLVCLGTRVGSLGIRPCLDDITCPVRAYHNLPYALHAHTNCTGLQFIYEMESLQKAFHVGTAFTACCGAGVAAGAGSVLMKDIGEGHGRALVLQVPARRRGSGADNSGSSLWCRRWTAQMLAVG